MRVLPAAAGRPPAIMLTDFLDFSPQDGAARISKVRELNYRPPYSVLTDYWKPGRDAIREFHRLGGADTSIFERAVARIRNPRRAVRHREALAAYAQFVGRKDMPSFPPRKGTWRHEELRVSVNPELGLRIKGHPTLVKLHFKPGQIVKRRLQAVFQMMEETVGGGTIDVAVLDVPNRRLHVGNGASARARVFLETETAALLQAWRRL